MVFKSTDLERFKLYRLHFKKAHLKTQIYTEDKKQKIYIVVTFINLDYK